MPVYRWVGHTDRRVVVCNHGPGPLLSEIEKLYDEGYHKLDVQQERFTNRWHIDATRFIKVEEDTSDHNAWMEH